MDGISADEVERGIHYVSRNGPPSESSHLFLDRPQLHDHFEIYFIKAGDVAWLIENEVHPAPPRSLVLFNDQEIHKLQIRSDQRFERMILFFDPKLARGFESIAPGLLDCFTARPKGEGNIIRLSLPRCDELLRDFDRLDEAFRGESRASALVKLLALLDILLLTSGAFSESSEPGEGRGLPGKIADTLRFVDAHLAEDLSLESLSAALRINRHYLCRMFKKETGSTLHNYILYKRVSAAKLLLDDGVKIPQVAALTGFGSIGRFNAAYKKVLGFSPSSYAKRLKTKN